jgi:hypothetical protein
VDAHTPRGEDELSEVERRLTGWRPGAEGLDADAMLFAAGLAAGQREWGRRLAPALCGFLAALAAGLGAWGLSERAGRLVLVGRLPERAPAPSAPPVTAVAVLPESSYTPSPDDYIHLRRRAEQDPGRWLASAQPTGTRALGPPLPEPAIFRAGQRDGLLDQ